MAGINAPERVTQNHVIRFFSDKHRLNYTYIGNLHDSENSNIMQERLRAYLLRRGYSEKLITGAIDALVKASTNLQQGLYAANKEVYSLLKYGANVKENVGEPEKTVYFIDFDNPSSNDFSVAEEVTVPGDHTKRPDIAVYVNGIALAVIELKKSTISVSDGIRQNLNANPEATVFYNHTVLHGRQRQRRASVWNTSDAGEALFGMEAGWISGVSRGAGRGGCPN